MDGDNLGNYITWPGLTTVYSAPLASSVVAATEDKLEAGKEVENAVSANLENRSDEFCAVMFYQLIALGWTREKAHNVKRKMGLTQ